LQTFGVIYVAYGAPYLAMAVVSLLSLRTTNPDVPVCIVTNVVREPPQKPWWRPDKGDQWIFQDDGTDRNRNAKTSVYQLSPFDLTLFLDCDTMVLGDLSPISGYLEYFDVLLSAVYNPDRNPKRKILDGKYHYTSDGHFNSGVFGFRRGEEVETFFNLWNERFHALGYRLDQPALVEAYCLSKVRMFPLSFKWNCGDKWADLTAARDLLVVWHYKFRPEPLVKVLTQRAVTWFGGTDQHVAETRQFLRARRNHYSPRWALWRIVIKIRGEQSRRLEKHPNQDQWLNWIGRT
jgi:hypothetical protein